MWATRLHHHSGYHLSSMLTNEVKVVVKKNQKKNLNYVKKFMITWAKLLIFQKQYSNVNLRISSLKDYKM